MFGLEYYILYNLLIGPFFAFRYYNTEGRIVETKEFLRLLLLPAVGYSYWLYKREIRANKIPEFPRRWFVWKKMIPINWGFIGIIAAFGLVLIIWLAAAGSDFDINSNSGLEFLFELGAGLMAAALIGSFFFFFGLLVFLLIFLPHQFAKSIEAETYKRKYLDERGRNQG